MIGPTGFSCMANIFMTLDTKPEVKLGFKHAHFIMAFKKSMLRFSLRIYIWVNERCQSDALSSLMAFNTFTNVLHSRFTPWWHLQMKTFSALLALRAGNSPVIGEFTTQRPVTRSFDVFFDLRLNWQWSKQSCGWWFETPSRRLWRQCNDTLCACIRTRTHT